MQTKVKFWLQIWNQHEKIQYKQLKPQRAPFKKKFKWGGSTVNKHQLVVGRNKIIWLITRIYGILYYQFYAIQISMPEVIYIIHFIKSLVLLDSNIGQSYLVANMFLQPLDHTFLYNFPLWFKGYITRLTTHGTNTNTVYNMKLAATTGQQTIILLLIDMELERVMPPPPRKGKYWHSIFTCNARPGADS